jgi:uncharacterized transporter YbjL
MDRLETLKGAVEARNDEILGYQINIDNYERAIAKINKEYSDKPEILKFRDQLIDMLESHKTEQLKTIIIRDVIVDQLKEIEEA